MPVGLSYLSMYICSCGVNQIDEKFYASLCSAT
jgi:hypothetical protein